MQIFRMVGFAWKDSHGRQPGNSWMAARPSMQDVQNPPGACAAPAAPVHLLHDGEAEDLPLEWIAWSATALLPDAVAALVQEEISQRAYAHSQDPGDQAP